MACESRPEGLNSGRQAQHLMETNSSTEGSEDVSSWKNKSEDLQERFTEKVAQVEMKWWLMLKEAEEKKKELVSLFLRSESKKKASLGFSPSCISDHEPRGDVSEDNRRAGGQQPEARPDSKKLGQADPRVGATST